MLALVGLIISLIFGSNPLLTNLWQSRTFASVRRMRCSGLPRKIVKIELGYKDRSLGESSYDRVY
jgi:hypothetical protein